MNDSRLISVVPTSFWDKLNLAFESAVREQRERINDDVALARLGLLEHVIKVVEMLELADDQISYWKCQHEDHLDANISAFLWPDYQEFQTITIWSSGEFLDGSGNKHEIWVMYYPTTMLYTVGHYEHGYFFRDGYTNEAFAIRDAKEIVKAIQLRTQEKGVSYA